MCNVVSQSILFDAPGPKARARIRAAAVVSVIIVAAIVAAALWQLGLKGHLDPQRWSVLFTGPILSYLGVGLINSLLSGLIAGVIAAPLAVLVAVGRRHGPRWLRWILSGYVELIRSLPLLVLIYFFFLFLPSVEIKVSPLWQLVIPLVLNNVAMISDIFRAGMDGVSRGEIEAAHSLGLPSWRVITKVILPQATAIVLPALITQYVRLFKETSLGFVVSFSELLTRGRVMAEFTHSLFETYALVGATFVVINILLGWIARTVQARMSRS